MEKSLLMQPNSKTFDTSPNWVHGRMISQRKAATASGTRSALSLLDPLDDHFRWTYSGL